MTEYQNRDNSQIPFSTGIIERPRLISKLSLAINQKLTLVSAPPGYGKTTAVAQFARQSDIPVAWHTLEERERDVPNLHRQSLRALQILFPDIGTAILTLDITIHDSASQITNYIRDHAIDDIFYVLDDVHYLTNFPSAEQWLQTFVELLPPKCHLILISRVIPTLPLTEMIARREVQAIGTEDLRFRLEEIEALAARIGELELPSTDIAALEQYLEGWPAGTILALQPLPTELEHIIMRGKTGPESLFEALAETMLSQETPDMHDFLLASSVLSRITPELCSKVLSLNNSGLLLTRALARNLFLSRIAGGLVYHRIFRDFLQKRLQERFPERFKQLNSRAAVWFVQQNNLVEAFDHFLCAGLVTEAIELTGKNSRAYFIQGHLETLLTWHQQLQDDVVNAPQLLYSCSMIYTDRYDYDRAIELLELAKVGFQRQNNDTGLTEVKLQLGRIDLLRGSHKEVIQDFTAINQQTMSNPNLQARIQHLLGLAYLQQGDYQTSVDYLEKARAWHEVSSDRSTTASVLQDLEVAYTRSGRLDEAGACLQREVALWRAVGRADSLALSLNNLGYHYHQRGNYTQALLTLKEGLQIAARTSNKRSESYLMWSMGDLHRDLANFSQAIKHYHKALEISQSREPALQYSLIISMSVLYRWQHNYGEAAYLAGEAFTLAERNNLIEEQSSALAHQWAARAASGETQAGLQKLDEILQDLQKQHAGLAIVQMLGLCATTALLCLDEAKCHHYLSIVLAITGDQQSIQPIIAEAYHTPILREFIEKHALQYGIIAYGIRELDKGERFRYPSLSFVNGTGNQPTYSIRVFTLGMESVERDGNMVDVTAWRANKAREFFFYLLFTGAIRREELSLEFWPERSAKQVRSNFHTTLHRSRNVLGNELILYENGLYTLNPRVEIWCDAHQFDSWISQARLLPLNDPRAEDLWNRAVDCYQGEFLTSLDKTWVNIRREQYGEMYLEALIGKGNCIRVRKDYREAIYIYRQGLEIDPFRENIHRSIMKCLDDMGERKQVFEYYRNLRDLFDLELGLEPSSQTIEFAEKLIYSS